jgi:hypothetical protein
MKPLGVTAAFLALVAAFAPSLAAQDEGIPLRAELDVTLLYRYRSADELVEPYADKSGIDLQRNYFDLPPLARASVDIGGNQGLAAGFELEARREFIGTDGKGYLQSNNFDIVGSGRDPIAIEKQAITRGVLYWRSPSLDLSIGRDKLDYGKELEGTFYPSARLPYLDAFRARGRLGPFGLDWMIATMDGIESFDDNDVDPNEYYKNGTYGTYSGTGTEYYGFEYDDVPTTIVECLHRVSWNFGSARLGLAENCLLARRNNRFTVTDFLPLVSWHQTSVMPNNVTLLADFAWEPLEGLTLAAQGGFDDFNANSVGIGDSGVPTIGAALVGGRYEAERARGALDAYLEAGYTHYLWGNFSAYRQGELTDVDPLARAIYRFRLNAGGALLPLTSPYGPGALWLRLEGGWRFGGSGPRIGGELLLLGKNTEANLITTLYDKSASSGHTLFFGSLTMPVSWRLGAFELSAAPAALVRNGTWWMESTFAATYRYRGERSLGGTR